MSNSYEFPSGGGNTGFFPNFHSNEKPYSTHLFPSDKMFGQPVLLNASAVVEDLSGTFNFFVAVTSQQC